MWSPLRAGRRALLAGALLLAAPPANAGLSGALELQSQTTQNLAPGADGSPSTLLSESLSLHWAGLPFGDAVAVAAAGGSLSNVTGWMGRGARVDGRVVSFDASMGFLPRRAVPLRLYASGSLEAGSGRGLASGGAGPSLLYGATLHLEPGLLPALRVDASEARSSRPGNADLSDRRRRIVATSHGSVAGQRVSLGARMEDDRREGFGEVTTLGATLSVSSAVQQTTVVASEVRRSIASLAGLTSDRSLNANGTQRWSDALTTQAGARLAEAGAAGARGTLADARAAFTWVPLAGTRQLTLSGGGSAGVVRTEAPGAGGDGSSRGGSLRVAWDEPFGRFTGGLGIGAAVDACDCSFGNDGTTTLAEVTLSAGLPAAGRGSGQGSYTLVRAFAPLSRGGDRLEHRARASGRFAPSGSTVLQAAIAYDEGTRELLDITTGTAATLEERTVTGSLGVAAGVGGVALSGDLRHTRGRVVADASPFVSGRARQARTITSGQASAGWRPGRTLAVRLQAIGTWTTLDDSTSIGSFGANAALDWRLGLVTASLQYQGLRVALVDADSSFQHSIRTVVTRPFGP